MDVYSRDTGGGSPAPVPAFIGLSPIGRLADHSRSRMTVNRESVGVTYYTPKRRRQKKVSSVDLHRQCHSTAHQWVPEVIQAINRANLTYWAHNHTQSQLLSHFTPHRSVALFSWFPLTPRNVILETMTSHLDTSVHHS